MSLTLGSGPLAGRPAGTFNFDIAAASPPHRILFQPFGPRVRAIVGDDTILDSVRAHLLYETGLPPRVYAPLEDYDMDRFTRTETTTHCPFKGDASYWSLGGRADLPDLLWAYEDPIADAPFLQGMGALYPDRVDAWFAEEDRVLGHFRDPFHRVDVHESTRPVTVTVDGEVVARSDRPKLLFETSLPVRVYVPPADVRPGAVAAGTGKRTVCPYKGEATYWTVNGVLDAAWSYESPLPDALRAQGHLAFDAGVEGVEISLDPTP